MNKEQIIKALAALAHQVRLQVFRALVVAGAPSVLSEQLEVPSTALSFHLKELVNAGLVTQERMSRNLIYRADFIQMDGVLGYLTQNCCAGSACELTESTCCPAGSESC
ncbi:MAG: helix-turn-helix domain-containing protein [Comamonas sp.]|uniref:ArsR/SmtB family transcription factor n=1 Tax=Comamonas sp. TaxID=34028 RepID=UPI002FC775A5